MPPQQRITLNPDPPVQGQEVDICYDFVGSGVTSTRLRVTFTSSTGDPPGAEYEVDEANNCVKVTVPSDAETILVEDLDGPSPDQSAIVENG